MAKPRQMVVIQPRKTKYQDKITEQEKEIEDLLKGETSEEEQEEEVVAPELEEEDITFKKRYGDLRRHASKVEKELKEEIEALKSAEPDEPLSNLPATDEEIEAWGKKYPEVFDIVTSLSKKAADEKFKEANMDLSEVKDRLSQVKKLRAEDDIREVHKDFDKLKDSDKFHDWIEEQPEFIQDALFKNTEDAPSVIRVIDLYKSDMGLTKAAKKSKAKSAATIINPKSKTSIDVDESGSKISESQIQAMSDKEFSEREEEILKAQQTGNFIYDVTGGAR